MLQAKQLLLSAAVCGSLIVGSAEATIVFSDNFDGPFATDLNGLAPDIAPGAELWVAAPTFDADGTIEDTGGGSATLAFAPADGFVYTLDASFRNFAATGTTATPVENDWVAMGFINGQSSINGNNERFVSGNVNGIAWMLMRGDITAVSNTAFSGLSTSGTQSNTGGTPWSDPTLVNTFAVDIDMRVVLDTSGGTGTWNATWYAKLAADSNYAEVRATETLVDEAINSIGFARSNTGFTASITSFTLDAEATSSFLLGDTNNDGTVDTLDIDPFVLLLTDPAGYATAFPGVDSLAVGDINMDTVVDTLDIDPFVALLTAGSLTGGGAVPEPGSIVLLGLAGVAGIGFVVRRK